MFNRFATDVARRFHDASKKFNSRAGIGIKLTLGGLKSVQGWDEIFVKMDESRRTRYERRKEPRRQVKPYLLSCRLFIETFVSNIG
jgi:hypothetical protein